MSGFGTATRDHPAGSGGLPTGKETSQLVGPIVLSEQAP
jgi:hypothetical protein